MLAALPLLAMPVLIYNIVVLIGAGRRRHGRRPTPGAARAAVLDPDDLGRELDRRPRRPAPVLSLVVLFVELLKSTTSRKVAIINHALSMILFVVCLVEFLLIRGLRDLDLLPDHADGAAGRAGRLHRHHRLGAGKTGFRRRGRAARRMGAGDADSARRSAHPDRAPIRAAPPLTFPRNGGRSGLI